MNVGKEGETSKNEIRSRKEERKNGDSEHNSSDGKEIKQRGNDRREGRMRGSKLDQGMKNG